MPIDASVPFEKPAIDAETFDKWCIYSFQSIGSGINNPTNVAVVLRRARFDGENWHELPGEEKTVNITDVYSQIPTYTSLGVALQAIVDAVIEVGTAQGDL